MHQLQDYRHKNLFIIKNKLKKEEKEFQRQIETAYVKKEKSNIKLETEEIFQVISDINDNDQISQAMKFIKDRK